MIDTVSPAPRHIREGRVALRFVVAYVATLVVGVVLLVLVGGYGDPGSRAALGLPVVAPVASVVIDEDSPSWDCRTMGNLTCGYGSVGGPVAWRSVAEGPIVACPGGAALVDLPFASSVTLPADPEAALSALMGTVGCDHGHRAE